MIQHIHDTDRPFLLESDSARDALTALACHLGTAPTLGQGKRWSINAIDGNITVIRNAFQVVFYPDSATKRPNDYARDRRRLTDDCSAHVRRVDDQTYHIISTTDEVISALKSALGINSAIRANTPISTHIPDRGGIAQKRKKRSYKHQEGKYLHSVKMTYPNSSDKAQPCQNGGAR